MANERECLHAKYVGAENCAGELVQPHDDLPNHVSCRKHHDEVIAEWADDGQAFQKMLDSGTLDHYLGIKRERSTW